MVQVARAPQQPAEDIEADLIERLMAAVDEAEQWRANDVPPRT
jgi:hypothetical protein